MPTSGTFFAGKDGSATVDGVSQPSRKWEAMIEVTEVDVTNHKSPTAGDGSKWREYLGSFSGGNVTIDCVADLTLSQPVQGEEMAYSLGIGGGHAISGQMVLKSKRFYHDIDNTTMVSYQGRMTGAPTIV